VNSSGAGMLTTLPDDMLAAALHDCCAIDRWVDEVLARRPFHDDAAVTAAADEAFAALTREDWQQGLAAAGALVVPADGEAGTRAAAELALRLYRERFGYVFVSGAPHLVADELLMRIRIRLGHDEEAELRTACAELRRRARARLARLLSRGAPPA
jgi:2-oxo-4-hydroxy-4-carboxy-5-ureidoimidazoline decarboxylase